MAITSELQQNSTSFPSNPYITRRKFLSLPGLMAKESTKNILRIGISLSTLPLLLDNLHALDTTNNSLDVNGKHLIFGTHQLDAQAQSTVDKFNQTGDLSLSQWPLAIQTIVDNNMRQARKKDKPYILVLDSVDSSGLIPCNDPQNNSTAGWTWLPFGKMDLMDESVYPQSLILVGADIPKDLSLNDFYSDATDTEPQEAIKKLSSAMWDKYSMISPHAKAEEFPDGVKAIGIDVFDDLIVSTGLAIGMTAAASNELIKRRDAILKSLMILGCGINILNNASTAWKVLGYSYVLSDNIGEVPNSLLGLPNIWWQTLGTKLANTSQQTQGDSTIDLWLNARTALAVEKAQSFPQADILYGAAHNEDALAIMDNPAHRRQVIQAYTRDLLQSISYAIAQEYDILKPRRNNILARVGNSLQTVMKMSIHDAIPWGKTYKKTYFGNKFFAKASMITSPVVSNIVNKELQQLDVPLDTLPY